MNDIQKLLVRFDGLRSQLSDVAGLRDRYQAELEQVTLATNPDNQEQVEAYLLARARVELVPQRVELLKLELIRLDSELRVAYDKRRAELVALASETHRVRFERGVEALLPISGDRGTAELLAEQLPEVMAAAKRMRFEVIGDTQYPGASRLRELLVLESEIVADAQSLTEAPEPRGEVVPA